MHALLVIDMQDAYFKSPGLTSRKPQLIARINQLIAQTRQAGGMIVNIRTVHLHDKSTWTLNMLEDDQGFAFEGAKDTKNLPALKLDDAVDITKTRDSAFHETGLLALLQARGVTDITLAGVSTHSCVFHTAASAYAFDFKVKIHENCVDDEDQEAHRVALEYLRKEYRQEIIS
jgi:nicotinamidase-related amidase